MKPVYEVLDEKLNQKKLQKYKKITIFFSSMFVGLNIVDLVETKIALSSGFIELNPIVNYMFSIGFGELFKATTTLIVLLCFYLLYKINPKLTCGVSCILLIFISTIVVWNLIQIFCV